MHNSLVLIPAFNEEKNIKTVVASVRSALPGKDILVINDGSSDDTGKLLGEIPGIITLHHPFNSGIGQAIVTGFRYFLDRGYSHLIRIDGDGQHPPVQAESLLKPILEDKADMVIGSRFIEKKGFQSSLPRRGGIKLLNILASFLLGQKITDNTSGFKAYTREAVHEIVDDYPHDYPEPIEVYLLAKRGLRIKEVPVHMLSRQGGLSSIGRIDSYAYLIKVLLTILIKYAIGGKK